MQQQPLASRHEYKEDELDGVILSGLIDSSVRRELRGKEAAEIKATRNPDTHYWIKVVETLSSSLTPQGKIH